MSVNNRRDNQHLHHFAPLPIFLSIADKLPFTDTSDDCIVELDGKYLIKRQNETWIDVKDPCKVHKCQLGADGFPTENQFREYCYLTCNNVSIPYTSPD